MGQDSRLFRHRGKARGNVHRSAAGGDPGVRPGALGGEASRQVEQPRLGRVRLISPDHRHVRIGSLKKEAEPLAGGSCRSGEGYAADDGYHLIRLDQDRDR